MYYNFPRILCTYIELPQKKIKGNISTLYGISFKEGNGCYLRDVDDNKYLDCLTGASTNILGYKTFNLAEEHEQYQAGETDRDLFSINCFRRICKRKSF